MQADWNQRAREDAHYYVAFGSRDQDEEGFLATARDVVSVIESELKRLPATDPRTRRALEIGCGPGRLMKPLSRHFGEIHGVDVSDEMVRLARQRLAGIPHAHAHVAAGLGLPMFAGESFDIVYSYAVYQHIPSRDVVLAYMRETQRVLKPGGVFRGQFNGLPPNPDPNTWSGVSFSEAEIREFAREQQLQLLAIEGAGTQYLWTTWRKPLPQEPAPAGTTALARITNAHTGEPLLPASGRHAAVSLWMANLPRECDVNTLELRVDGTPAAVYYIGPPDTGRLQQVNVRLPPGIRTGLVPIELEYCGRALCPASVARIVPAGPLVPQVVTVTDGINLIEENRSTTGTLKIQIEELLHPDQVSMEVAGESLQNLGYLLTDPIPPRYEFNALLPEGLVPGRYNLQILVGRRPLLPRIIDVASQPGVRTGKRVRPGNKQD
jgi:SAM-dependent methyltransferase